MVCEDWLLFQNAMNQEISSHWKCSIYEKVSQSSVPAEALLLSGQWVYKIKCNQEGKPVKYKVCWVIYSYKQQEGIDFYETFVSVVCMNSWKLILVLCIIHDLYICHYNIVMVFLNGVLDELLYMQYSTKYEVAGYILRLLKTLYSLKQLLHVWYTCLHEHFEVIELVVSPYDPSVFINKGSTVNIIIAVYVNNLLVCDSSMNLVDYVLKHL